jgi:hypothetical protein
MERGRREAKDRLARRGGRHCEIVHAIPQQFHGCPNYRIRVDGRPRSHGARDGASRERSSRRLERNARKEAADRRAGSKDGV